MFYQDSEGNDSDSDSDIPDELKQDYIDEITGEARSHRLVTINHTMIGYAIIHGLLAL